MVQLIAYLSTGKGTWGHVKRLIDTGDWEKVVLLTNDFGKEKFTPDAKTELIVLENMKPLKELITDIEAGIKGKITGDVAINLVSGSGKEHMALLTALKNLKIEYSLTAITKEGIETF